MPRHNADTTLRSELRRRYHDAVKLPASVSGEFYLFQQCDFIL